MTVAKLRICLPLSIIKRLLWFYALGCATCSSQLYASWQDPLSADEVSSATAIVMSQFASGDSGKSAISAAGRGSRELRSADDFQHPLGVQVLLVELKEQKQTSGQTSRLAEVFIFDYQRGVTELNLIDVESDELIVSTEIASVHLPLSEEEINYSKTLIWNHTEFVARVQREAETLESFPAIVNRELTDLQTNVSILVPNNRTGKQPANCGLERCALISLFSNDNHSFSVEPVINLMSGEIYLDRIP